MRPIAAAKVQSTDADYKHDIETGGHRLVADEPQRAGGGNAGPAPFELFLSGLGACTAITLRMYAQHSGWELGQLSVALELRKDRDGKISIERSLHASASLSDEQWTHLLAIAEKTPVTLTVKQGASIQTYRD